MLKKTWIIAAAAAFSLAGCLETDLQRGAVGAAGGALLGPQIGLSETEGALAGAAGALLLDNAGLARQSR